MASTFNLVRNSRVWFSGNVNANTGNLETGATITDTGTTATVELTVLDGFSFSQGTQQQTIQLSEAGNTPVRGQRAFNTALDPVDFSFSTYIRPKGTSAITCEEQVLWNALMCANPIHAGLACTISQISRTSTTTNAATITCTAVNLTSAGLALNDIFNLGGFASTTTAAQEWSGPVKLIGTTGGLTAATVMNVEYLIAPTAAATAAGTLGTATKIYNSAWFPQGSAVSNAAYAQVNTGMSNKNQLQKFGLYFLVDNAVYAIDNCVLDQAVIDFGLDGIAMVAWTGKGTRLNYLPLATISAANPAVFAGTGIGTGTAVAKMATSGDYSYITNKLSTMTLISNIMGGGTQYNVALTGGSITIANNVNYVVPANLGVVNQSIGYFTGSRAISGSVTAYLRTGTNNTAQILSDILTANAAETKFQLKIQIGGSSNAVHVDLNMNGCVLQVPTVETGDVMSTTINFTTQGYDPIAANNTYDIGQTNDLTINYYNA